MVASGQGLRIDHCRFEYVTAGNSGLYGITVQGPISNTALNPTGVIDHCQFYNRKVLVKGNPSTNFNLSGAIWAAQLGLGTSNFVFVEDNTFLMTTSTNSIDSNDSSRYVFRHNDLEDSWIEAHSAAPTRRGSRAWEIYENTIRRVNKSVAWPMLLRAGTGVCFNNTMVGTFNGIIAIDNRRSTPNDDFGTQANGAFGANPMDGNTLLIDDSGYNFLGTHNGDTSSPVKGFGMEYCRSYLW